jgi:hypothetical protein
MIDDATMLQSILYPVDTYTKWGVSVGGNFKKGNEDAYQLMRIHAPYLYPNSDKQMFEWKYRTIRKDETTDFQWQSKFLKTNMKFIIYSWKDRILGVKTKYITFIYMKIE